MRTNRKITQCMLLGLFRQCIIIILIVTEVANVDLPRFKCPETSQWKFRAASECNDTDKYICLFDENGQKDEEFCGSWPDFENPGYKQILLGGTTREPCSDNRFQPFTFWTNGSSKCVYKKTNCNQEGQVIHNNGSLKTNRICRCDYTNNYDFVLKPRNSCFCVPSEEDCSCYVKTCPTGHRLTRDYECLKESKLKFNCPEIYKDSTDEQMRTTTIITLDEQEISAGSVAWSAIIVTLVCMSACLVLFLVYHMRINSNNFGVSTKSRNVQEEESVHYILEKKRDLQTGMNGFNKYQTTCLIPYDVLDLQEKEIMKWRERHMLFEETTASKTVLDKMKTHRFVIISGPPGSGKSAIAYNTAFQLEKDKEFKILPVSSPEEIRKYLLPETKQVFLIDDVVGKYTVDETCIQRWKNEETFIKQTLTERSNTKLILTCRSYIYKSGFNRKLNLSPVHCDLLSYDLELSLDERKNICHMYDTPELNEEIVMMYTFLPLLCVGFKADDHSPAYFVHPYEVLRKEMIKLKEISDITFLTIALLIVQDNYIDRQILSLENHTIKELLNDLCNECEFRYFPSTTALLSALYDLIGTYTTSTADGFACIHDNLFKNLSFIVGGDIIHCLLRYGSTKFLSNRLQLYSVENEHDELLILIKPEQQELLFNRLISDIKKGNHSDLFTGKLMTDTRFRSTFKEFLKVHLKAEDLKCNYISSPLHVVSEQGYDDLAHTLIGINKDQLCHLDKHKRTPLYMACLGGHCKLVKTILAIDKTTLDVPNIDDLTPLDVSSTNDHSSTVNVLLDYDANLNRKDKKTNKTALQRACENGHYTVVKRLLLSPKLDVTNKDISGLQAIHIACLKGHLQIVKLLIDAKNLLNALDADGRTPLFIASESSQQNIVCMLLEKKANVNQSDVKNISPLHKACQIGNDKIVGLLLDNSAKINVKSDKGYSALHVASMKGELKCVEILIDKNADLDLTTKQGWTPLFISCSKGHFEICKILLISGANINRGDKDATTPLHVACREKHERIVRSLIKHDVNVNAVDSKKESPLYIACAKECFDIVQLLINNHADLNICNQKGNIPLHIACFKGNKTIVQLILDQKANIHKRNQEGKTPFDIVQEKKNDSIVDMFNCYKEKRLD